jgi:hypothetical protein
MPSDRKPSLILPVAVVALLLAAYVGAYYATVQPLGKLVSSDTWMIAVPFYGPESELYHLDNAPWQERLQPFFAPIHWLDRRIRPQVWRIEDMRRELQNAYKIR